MTTLVFFLEEPSAKELLQGLLPRLIAPSIEVRYVVFEGKQDLEKQLERKLSGWRAPNSIFVVLRDQDSGDCKVVKKRLTDLVTKSGRRALVRVACRELESWIAGDLAAVAQAFERPSVAAHASKAKFRDPDALGQPVKELRDLVPEYQKVDGARRIGRLLDPTRNSSRSFRAFCDGLQRWVQEVA